MHGEQLDITVEGVLLDRAVAMLRQVVTLAEGTRLEEHLQAAQHASGADLLSAIRALVTHRDNVRRCAQEMAEDEGRGRPWRVFVADAYEAAHVAAREDAEESA